MKKNPQINLYLMNQKGLAVLTHIISKFGTGCIARVIGARDPGVIDDYYNQLEMCCKKNGISFYDRDEFQDSETDSFRIAVGWQRMLSTNNLIVIHDSLLPKYRGFVPLLSALLNKEPEIGATAILGAQEYDAGDIIAQESMSVSYPLTLAAATEKMEGLYKTLVEKVIAGILSERPLKGTPQDEAKASYSLWRGDADFEIDWNDSAENIQHFVNCHGLPYAGASSGLDGRRVRILNVEVKKDVSVEIRQPGKVIFVREKFPIVVCGRGLLMIKEMVWDDNRESALPLKKFRSKFI